MEEPMVNEIVIAAGVEEEEVRPSEVRINVEMSLEAEAEISRRSPRVTPTTNIVGRHGFRLYGFAVKGDMVRRQPLVTGDFFEALSRINNAEEAAEFRRTLPSVTEFMFDTLGIDGDGEELSPEIRIMINEFSSDGRRLPAELPMLPEGGDGDDGDPPRPPLPVNRFMLFRIYALFPAISGTCIHILAGLMERTTENKLLIGVSLASLAGNVVATSWLIFRGGNLPNGDWKKITFKSMFAFSGTLTFYASFSTMSADLFSFPGIALCGVLAVGFGHSGSLTKLFKKLIARVKNKNKNKKKNATQRNRESTA